MISEERPRDAAIRTLPVVALDHRHIIIRIEVVLDMQAIPPTKNLVTERPVLGVHAPPVEAILEGREGRVLQA